MFTSYYNTRIIMNSQEYRISIFMNRLFINDIESDFFECLVSCDNRIIDDYTGEILLDDLGYISSGLIIAINKLGM